MGMRTEDATTYTEVPDLNFGGPDVNLDWLCQCIVDGQNFSYQFDDNPVSLQGEDTNLTRKKYTIKKDISEKYKIFLSLLRTDNNLQYLIKYT